MKPRLGHLPHEAAGTSSLTTVGRAAASCRATTAGLLVVAACGGDGRPGVTRVDSAGVEIVTYSGPDVPLAWTFDSLFALGGAEAGDQAFYEIRASLLGADAAGSIYVLDGAAKRIAVFDSSGGPLRTMGGPGGGPGEMDWPIVLVVRPDGRAAAFDVGKRALVWFGPSGEILDQEPAVGYSGGVGIHSSGTALTFPSQGRGQAAGVTTDRLVRVEGGDTTVLVSRPNPDAKSITLKSCGISMSGMEPLFAPTVRWAAAGDRVAVATVAEYEVLLFTGPDAAYVIRRSLEAQPATAEAARREVGPGMEIMSSVGRHVCDPGEVVQQRGFADRIPVIMGIAAGPDSTWWVRRHAGGGNGGIDVFASDGDYLGTLPASAPYPSMVLPGSRFAAIVTDQLDVDHLVVYRLKAGP